MTGYRNKSRLARLAGAVFSLLTLLFLIGVGLVMYPGSPLPNAWNPRVPLDVTAPVNPVTRWKYLAALGDGETCRAALGSYANFAPLPDFEASEQCHIRDQVALRGLGGARVTEVNTRCQTALRIAMWMQHGVQPAAQELLGQPVARLHHLSSYNCRAMRTGRGETTRMSTHATAEAIDITGVTLENGARLRLLADWNSEDAARRDFLRAMRDSACRWFRTTLSPDYNRLHADHFHLQHTGWGTCR